MARYNETTIGGVNTPSVAPVQTQQTKEIDTLASDIEKLTGGLQKGNEAIYKASEYATTLAAVDTEYNTKLGFQEIYNQTVGAKLAQGLEPTSEDYKTMIDWRTRYLKDVTQQVASEDDTDNLIYKEKFFKPSYNTLAELNQQDTVRYQNARMKESIEEFDAIVGNIKGTTAPMTVDSVNIRADLLGKKGVGNHLKVAWNSVAKNRVNNFMILNDEAIVKAINNGTLNELAKEYFGEYIYYDKDENLVNHKGVEDSAAMYMKEAFNSRISQVRRSLPDGENQSTAEYDAMINQIEKSISKAVMPTDRLLNEKWKYYDTYIKNSPNLSFSKKDTYKKQLILESINLDNIRTVHGMFRDAKGNFKIPDDKAYRDFMKNGTDTKDGLRIEGDVYQKVYEQQIATLETLIENSTVETDSANFQLNLSNLSQLAKVANRKPNLFDKFDNIIDGKLNVNSDINSMKQIVEYMRYQNATNGSYNKNKSFIQYAENIINNKDMDEVTKAKAIDTALVAVRTDTSFKSNLSDIRKLVDDFTTKEQSGPLRIDTVVNPEINAFIAKTMINKGLNFNESKDYLDGMHAIDVGNYFTLETDKTLYFDSSLSGYENGAADYIQGVLDTYNQKHTANVWQKDLRFTPIHDSKGGIGYDMYFYDNKGVKNLIGKITVDGIKKKIYE